MHLKRASKKKRKAAKGVSMLIVLCMVFSLMPVNFIFADSEPKIQAVVMNEEGILSDLVESLLPFSSVLEEQQKGLDSDDEESILLVSELRDQDLLGISEKNTVDELQQVIDDNLVLLDSELGIQQLSSVVEVHDIADLQQAIDDAVSGDTILISVELDGEQLPKTLEINDKSLVFSADTIITLGSPSSGRHIEISGNSVRLEFNGVILDGRGVSGGIESEAQELTICNVMIQHCYNLNGGAISAVSDTQTTVIGENTLISGNKAQNGGGVYIANGDFTLEDKAVIQNCTAVQDGGGVYVIRGNFNLKDNAVIENCEAGRYGGGVIMDKEGNFNMVESTIRYCKAFSSGGGVYINSVDFTMEADAVIEQCDAGRYGGGVSLSFADIIINGGNIIDNRANDGGGLSLDTSGTITVYGGKISNNTVNVAQGTSGTGNGGGIYCKGTLVIDAVSEVIISGNITANCGGGIYSTNGNIKITGGTISGNEALNNGSTSSLGGGIHSTIGTVDTAIKGTVISGNKAGLGGGIYTQAAPGSTGGVLLLDGVIVDNNEANGGGGIHFASHPLTVTDSEIINNRIMVSDFNGSGNPAAGNGNGAGIYTREGAININGGKISGNIITVQDNINITHTPTGSYIGNYTGALITGSGGGIFTNSGNIFLKDVLIEDNKLLGGENISITLNGIPTSSTLISIGNGGGVYTQSGNMEIEDCVIKANKAESSTYVSESGHIILVSGNGGGVFGYANNTADRTIKITGNSEISGNTAINGGGVYGHESTLSVVVDENAKITDNTAVINGGGIYGHMAKIAVDDSAQISGNTAIEGGGIYTGDISYQRITTGEDTIFKGNSTLCYYTDAPIYPNIQSASTSVGVNLLNNYDINYLGQTAYYIVQFDANGGTPVANIEEVHYGSAIDKPLDPTRNGYSFKGWYKEASLENKWDFDTDVVTESITLYAGWIMRPDTPIYYIVQFNANGGTSIVDIKNISYGSTIDKPMDPTRKGYSFEGWYKEASLENKWDFVIDTVTESIMLYAGWTEIRENNNSGGGGGTSFVITYNPNGATGNVHRVAGFNYGNIHTVLHINNSGLSYVRSGYNFAEWNTKPDGTGKVYAPKDIIRVTGSITLYAQWKEENLELETEKHIRYINGYPDGTVRPNGSITRGEAAAIFYRLLVNPGTAVNEPFSDISSDAWYAQSVNYLASMGVLRGYEDGSFRPDQTITRAEFTVLVSVFNNLSFVEGNTFSDVTNEHWAISYIGAVHAKGWIIGYPDGTFQPENPISRGEVVKIVNTMLNRRIELKELPDSVSQYTDLDRFHWAYCDIMEASIEHEYIRKDNGYEIWN